MGIRRTHSRLKPPRPTGVSKSLFCIGSTLSGICLLSKVKLFLVVTHFCQSVTAYNICVPVADVLVTDFVKDKYCDHQHINE